MNLPNPYLANVLASLDPRMSAPGQTVTPEPPPPAEEPPPPPPGDPAAPVPWKSEDPLANQIPDDVAGVIGKAYDAEAPKPPEPPQAQGGPQQQRRGPPERTFARVGGGYSPAHEVDLRGPSLRGAQARANAAQEDAAESGDARSQAAAVAEYATALDMQRKAQAREDAMMRAAAEREEEMATRQADFDQSVKTLSKASIDPERFWASRTTGQKILAIIGVTLGGYVQGVRGGSNVGLDVLNAQIDRDLKAQEFSYNATRDTVHAKQTAFSMAMQKYQNVDAARALARASALDAAQAQLMQNAALWKGTESANRAQDAIAQLEKMKAQQIAQGIRFMPASVGAPKYVDPNTGMVYTEAEAKAALEKARDHTFEMDKLERKGEIDISQEAAKFGLKGEADARGQTVEIPGVKLPDGTELRGEQVRAPNDAEATKLRAAAEGASKAEALVNEAKQIRQQLYRPSTDTAIAPWTRNKLEARLKTIESDLIFAVKDTNGLGALSNSDIGLAQGAIGGGTLTSVGVSADAGLDSYLKHVHQALRNKVKTYPDSSPRARGAMPGSFTPAGKK